MTKSALFIFSLLSILLLVGCDRPYVFEKTQSILDSAWHYDNGLAYTFDISDTASIYNIVLEMEHSSEYAYQNCYLKIHTGFPNGKKTAQVLSVDFADGIGRWQGDCGSKSCKILIDLQKNARFNQLGKHTIYLEQYMRKSPLVGINSVTLKLETPI